MENNNKIDSECCPSLHKLGIGTQDYHVLYRRIINSYEEENFELFKKLVDPIDPE